MITTPELWLVPKQVAMIWLNQRETELLLKPHSPLKFAVLIDGT